MMLNTSGGMVGGDFLHSSIDVGADAAAVLISASAAKVYRTVGPAARQETTIRLGPGAAIEYLPDHLIPHPGAIYHQTLHVEMGPGGRAIIWDAIASGRIGREERWRFVELRSETIVTRDERPLHISRSRIAPAEHPPDQLGLAESFNYLGTMIVADDTRSSWRELASGLDNVVCMAPGIRGGVGEIGGGGCVVRVMCQSATELREVFSDLWRVARQGVFNLQPFSTRRL
jgi:urease accessory protein